MVDNDPMVMDLSIPEAKTMQTHLASANPHPQYLVATSLASGVSDHVKLGDLLDVNIVGSELSGKVLALSGATWIPRDVNEIVSQQIVPHADTETYGTVIYAKMTDVSAGNSAMAVDPVVMKTFVSEYFNSTSAGPGTQGTVRLVSTDAEIAAAINNNAVAGLVEQVDFNRYVNTHAFSYITGTTSKDIINYKTYVGTVSNVAVISETSGYHPVYLVYSDGIMQSHVNKTRNDQWLHVMSDGNIYDTSTCGHVGIYQHGTARRTVLLPPGIMADDSSHPINDETDSSFIATDRTYDTMLSSAHTAAAESATWMQIDGLAHNLTCSATGWVTVRNVSGIGGGTSVVAYPKCVATVTSHGHLEFATIEGTGELYCDNTGIVENIVIHNTQSDNLNQNHYAMVITAGGTGYRITMNGSYARASIQGYAQDVRVYEGCVLDVTYATAKIEDLILYNGATLTLASGATIDGLVQYPGAVILTDGTCTINRRATCHEPDKVVSLVDAIDNTYSSITTETGTSEVLAQTFRFYGDTSVVSMLNYGTALLMESAAIRVVSGATSDAYVGEPLVQVFATDTPRGFLRINTDLVNSLNSGAVPITSRAEVMSSAYKYMDAVVVSRFDEPGATQTYMVSAPSGMYTDLTSSAVITWKLTF